MFVYHVGVRCCAAIGDLQRHGLCYCQHPAGPKAFVQLGEVILASGRAHLRRKPGSPGWSAGARYPAGLTGESPQSGKELFYA